MLKHAPLFAFLLLAAGCAQERASTSQQARAPAASAPVAARAAAGLLASPQSPSQALATGHTFASQPDRGDLVAYPATPVVRRDGAYTWHRADLSEAHAIRAIRDGVLHITAPSGEQLDFRYERHTVHPSGDWTWIGRLANGSRAEEILITFGAKAAFGTIAQSGGKPPLRLTIQDGVAWLVETDPALIAQIDNSATRPRRSDAPIPPHSAIGITAALPAQAASTPSAAASGYYVDVPVDLVLGYTTGFAQGLGGRSQAVTRLNNMVDIANQAFANSGVTMRLNLVHTREVSYPDNTSNDDALNKLTGYRPGSGPTTPDPAFNALRNAREQYGADLVSLVRRFNEPENEGCGVAWLIGGGQKSISSSDSYFGYSVVSDGRDAGTDGHTYFCRDESLAHEVGHNLGSQHDRATATTNGVVDYGVFSYSFGYKVGAAPGFYTVMAYGDTGQTPYRVFSNPRITFCGGNYCGVENQADNARSINQTSSLISRFRQPVIAFQDIADNSWIYGQTHRLLQAGVTSGCTTTPRSYCPDSGVQRDQMAIFLLRAKYGASYAPPPPAGLFEDVPTSHWAAAWIEQLYRESITTGCSASPARYCPEVVTTRAEMAVFLLRAKYGSNFIPPRATGMFQDVPTSNWSAPWVEKLAADGVTGGCSSQPRLYCPNDGVTRGQMAVFLVRNFGL